MTTEETLFWIMIATMITSVINTIEIIYLIRSSRRTNEILENPSPVICGLMDALKEDEKFAKEFGGFLVWVGGALLAGLQSKMGDAGMKPPKIKTLGDAFGLIFQLPNIRSAIEKKASQIVEGAGADAAQKIVEVGGWQ